MNRLMMMVILTFILLSFAPDSNFAQSTTSDNLTIGAKTKPQLPIIGPVKSIFADIAAKTVPTVVSVIPTKIDTVIYFNNPFFNFFFNDSGFGFNNPPSGKGKRKPPIEKKEYKEQGLGSGVIISSDGYILTNYHVVAGASEIQVKLTDGRLFDAKVVGTDSLADVAVIKIKSPVKDLPVAYLGNSDNLKTGDFVIAVGNPFALTSTVTMGIVSALNRQIGNNSMYQDFIQIDAAINPGNSGGALVNIDGEVIGINTMIYTESQGFMGIGFAVPINLAKRDAIDLIEKGKVVRGWIGVSIQEIDQSTRQALNLGDREGVLVADVLKSGPADKAGIKRGDVIMNVNGKKVTSSNALRNYIATLKPGADIPFHIFRAGKEMDIAVKIGELTSGKAPKPQPPRPEKSKPNEVFGLTIDNLNADLRSRLNIPSDVNGVIITAVDPSLNDSRAQLTPGDLIVDIRLKDKEPAAVTSVDQLVKIAQGAKTGDPVMLLIYRDGSTFYISFVVGK